MVSTQTIVIQPNKLPIVVQISLTISKGLPALRGVGVHLANTITTYKLLQHWLSLLNIDFKYKRVIVKIDPVYPFVLDRTRINAETIALAIGVGILKNQYPKKAGWFKQQTATTVWVGTLEQKPGYFSSRKDLIPTILATSQILAQERQKRIPVSYAIGKTVYITPTEKVEPVHSLYIANIFAIHISYKKTLKQKGKSNSLFTKTRPILKQFSEYPTHDVLYQIPNNLKKYFCFPILLNNLEPRRTFLKIYEQLQRTPNWMVFMPPCKCGNLLSNKVNCTCNILQRNEVLSRILALCHLSGAAHLYLPDTPNKSAPYSCRKTQKMLTL